MSILTADEAGRARIRGELGATVFAEAGAGTGKTTQLVARVVRLVTLSGARITSIGAITFTEAAAGELRDRVAEQLERVASGEPEALADLSGGNLDEPRWRARAADALGELDHSAITTLHGFARRILTEHPFEAGLPPAFEVHDEIRSAVAFEERWSVFVDELLADERHADAVVAGLTCGIQLSDLREIARVFNDNWDLVADRPPPKDAGRAQPPADASALRRSLGRAFELARWCCVDDDRLKLHLETLRRWDERLAGLDAGVDTLHALVRAPSLRAAHLGQAEHWQGYKDEVVAALDDAESARQAMISGAAGAALGVLLGEIGRFTLAAADARRRDGRLEYHDLLVRARNLVRDRPDVRGALSEQFRYLLIDEFQDTDPIQAELALRIGAGAEGGRAEWRDLVPDPGRLFFVGDPKQSIYRFRRADVGLFLEVRDRVVDAPVALTANHRSVSGILEWVNTMFGELIGSGETGGQPSYVPLEGVRPDHVGGLAPVVLLGGEGEAGSAEALRQHEASDIVRAIEAVVAEAWPVGEHGRPAELSDIAVLIPSRTALPALERALDAAGLPYRLEVSSLVYSAADVTDLLRVLRAVDDPTDEVSVVGALRSASFGCGDDDLLAFRQAGGSWDYRRPLPDALPVGHRVGEGMLALRAWHERRWWCDASVLIETVLADRRMLELALEHGRHRESWRRLRFVADQARRFADAFGGDLRRYLQWVQAQAGDDTRVSEAVLPERDHRAVRILTVHGAKGLEFPVVVLAGLNIGAPPLPLTRVLWGERGPEVAVRSVATPGFAALAAHEAHLEELEDVRQLYVAATRAADHLVVALHHRAQPTPRCAAARLEPICLAHPGLWRRLEATAPPPSSGPGATPAGEETTDTPTRRAAWMERRAQLLAAAAVPNSLAATAINTLARHPDGPKVTRAGELEGADEMALELPPWRRGRAGTAVGRAVHAVLQVIDLRSGANLVQLARRHAESEQVPERAGEVADLVAQALATSTVRTALERRHWRELYVGTPLAGRVVEGFIDLLVEGPDGYEVIDYKTDATPTLGDVDRAVARYRLQGATYALALEEVLDRPVTRCTFLFLRADGALARELTDLAAAQREVVALLESL